MTPSEEEWRPTGRVATDFDRPRLEWERGDVRVWTDNPDGPPQRSVGQVKRAQRRRQRERLRTDIKRISGERNRARQDRETLATFIEEQVEGAQVVREKSGQWFVVT